MAAPADGPPKRHPSWARTTPISRAEKRCRASRCARLGIYGRLAISDLGLFGGALSGLVGIGGAAVFVPSLVYVAGWDIKEAVGASLVITVFTALSGTLRGIRSEDSVNWKTFALLSSVVAPSTLVGVAISRFSPETLVQLVFATFLLFIAYPTAQGRSQAWPLTSSPASREPRAT